MRAMTHRPAAILVPVLLLGLLLGACARGPAGTVESFYRHLEQGELDAAIELVSDATVSQLGEDKLRVGLREVTQDIQDKGGLDEIEIVEEKTTGEVSEVTVVLHYGDDSTERETIDLVQKDGAWKLEPEK